MSSLVILKSIGALGVGSASLGGIGYFAYSTILKNNDARELKKFQEQKLSPGKASISSTAFALAEAVDLDSSIQKESILNIDSNRNYTCKLKNTNNKDDNVCVVKLINPLNNSKKQLNLTELKTLPETEPSIKDLSTKSKYFKVILADATYDAITWTSIPQNIEIFSTEDSPKKIGSLKPIVGLKSNVVNGQTIYSVGKITKFKNTDTDVNDVTQVNIEENESKCLFLTDPSSEVPFKINEFVENIAANQTDLKSLSFKGQLKTTSTINKDKYYLFEFTDSTNKKEKTAFKTSGDATVATKVKSVGSGAESTINKLEVTNLTPAFVLGNDKNHTILLISDIA